jgi:hypothetical protein
MISINTTFVNNASIPDIKTSKWSSLTQSNYPAVAPPFNQPRPIMHIGVILSIKKPDNICRIGFQNVDSLPKSIPNSKHEELVASIRSEMFDIMGMTETNLCWQHLPEEFQPYTIPAF